MEGGYRAAAAGDGAAPTMKGDEVRAARFWRTPGYSAAEVDELLGRVADELDAGMPPTPVIEAASFSRSVTGYDIDAVDWFLSQLLRQPGEPERDKLSWGAPSGVSSPVSHFTITDRHSALVSLSGRQRRSAENNVLSQMCADELTSFGEQPGTFLRLAWVSAATRELLTADALPLASVQGSLSPTVRCGGRTFTFRQRGKARAALHTDIYPELAGIAARSAKDRAGIFMAEPKKASKPGKEQREAREQPPVIRGIRTLTDDAGVPILFASGSNFGYRATARITFPDGRWLRFPVRGTGRSNAIMTAVDQTGSGVVQYRLIGRGFSVRRPVVEARVNPGQSLADELAVVMAISAPWLSSYFAVESGGG